MTVEHRFECALCGHRIHATDQDSATVRQVAREEACDHLVDAHAERVAATPEWPDDPSAADLLSDEAADGSLRGPLVPADDLLACDDCGYYFGPEDRDLDRHAVGESRLVCTFCHERRSGESRESVAEAIEQFVR